MDSLKACEQILARAIDERVRLQTYHVPPMSETYRNAQLHESRHPVGNTPGSSAASIFYARTRFLATTVL